jgi:hypothetical protein
LIVGEVAAGQEARPDITGGKTAGATRQDA